MPKGIKKIKFVPYINEANISNSRCSPDKWVIVPADKKAHFHIKEWHKDTTDAQKKGSLYWMVLDKDRKKIIDRLQCMTNKYFSFKIPKRFCGYPYYIEASMSGKPDINFTGLILLGECPPLLVSTTWSRTRGGKNIKNTDNKNDGLGFGEEIHFHADTEGINGEIVTVEVYNEMWNGDYKMRTVYNVTVTDGQINLKIPNTSEWKHSIKFIQKNEEFYVKIKRKNGKYLKDKDGKDRHGKYLNIKNEEKKNNKVKPSNEIPLIVGEPDKNIKKVGSCKFQKIEISDVDNFVVFEEGKTKISPISSKPSEQRHIVYFDFKKHDIRSDAQGKLNSLVSMLMANSHSRIIIDAHADERGADNFNMKLSQDRAEAIMNYLKKSGLNTSKFECHGHGENQLVVRGQNLSEEQHQKNRRASIRFNYYDTRLAPIVYETIAPTEERLKTITINVDKKTTLACKYKKGEHKQPNTITKKVNSIIGDDFVKHYLIYLAKYINVFSNMHKSYYEYINSCTYYPQKENPTLHIKAYPDIVWLAHGKYDYDGDYFFHNHSDGINLQKGFVPEFEALAAKIYGITSTGIVDYLLRTVLFDYLRSQAQKIEVGLHAVYNRKQEKKGTALSLTGTTADFVTQTKYTKYVTSLGMYEFVALQLVLEILILILTRGRSGISKIKSIKKLSRGLRKLKILADKMPEDLEIVGSSMAYRSGLYYYKQPDGRVALIWECDLKIDPLIAVEYKKEFDLLDYITDKAVKDKLSKKKGEDFEKARDKVKDTYGDKLSNIAASVTITGGLNIETNVKYNFLTRSYSFVKQSGNFYEEAKGTVVFGKFVRVEAKIELNIIKESSFFFNLITTKFKGKLDFEVKSSFGVYQAYGKDEKGFYVENYLAFSGLKVTLTTNAKLLIIKYTIFDFEYENKDVASDYIISKPERLKLFKIYLLTI